MLYFFESAFVSTVSERRWGVNAIHCRSIYAAGFDGWTKGSLTVKVVPSPSLLFTSISPLWFCTIP
jgi:hypothetical protein